LRWLGAAFVLLLAALTIFLALFRWNWLRGPIDDYASAQLQRQVVIHGDLGAQPWSWTPSMTARDVTVSQPPWAGKGQMARLPSLTVALDLKALLRGRLVLGAVDADHPTVVLERDASGRDNWNFGAPTAAPKPLKLPPIRHFTISAGAVTLDDARRRLRFAGRVSSNERLTGYGRGRFTLTGQGTLNGQPFLARILGGPLSWSRNCCRRRRAGRRRSRGRSRPARGSGVGDSVRAAAATSNGEVAVAIPRGQMRRLLAELMGIDVGRSLFLYCRTTRSRRQCAARSPSSATRGGVLTAQRLLIDTAAVRAEGGGVIDLRKETLNLAINGKPKHFRLLRLAAPITLKGRLDDPKLGVDVAKAHALRSSIEPPHSGALYQFLSSSRFTIRFA